MLIQQFRLKPCLKLNVLAPKNFTKSFVLEGMRTMHGEKFPNCSRFKHFHNIAQQKHGHRVAPNGRTVSHVVNSMSFIWNDNMREKCEANANAT